MFFGVLGIRLEELAGGVRRYRPEWEIEMTQQQGSEFTRRTFIMGAATIGAAAATTRARAQETKPATDKVRIGVVGGRFGAEFQWHLHPECEVVAVCDIDDTALQTLKTNYQCDNGYKSYLEMLKHPGLNAVAIFTPAPMHVWMATRAMKAGLHAVTAVPAGMSIEELEELLDCVKTTGMKYMLAETSYFRAPALQAMEFAKQGRFGTVFYTESEYHHEGITELFFEPDGKPSWRYGLPPMLYPTHCTGYVIPVTGERMTEVTAIGWGDGHEILQTNLYGNPFWNTTAFFKTSGGHASRMSVYWHVAAGMTERAAFYGDRMSYIMSRPEGSANMICEISQSGQTALDDNGYPIGAVNNQKDKTPDFFERLPEPMRVACGHGNSHTFITHEFVDAIMRDRRPVIDIYEALAYNVPGIIAHQSALKGGEHMTIPDYGVAPV